MAYDKELADRINIALTTINPPGLVSKKMFGGIGYLVLGNMACGILDDQLIIRVGKEAYQEMLARPGAGLFNTTGRPMSGWVMVDQSALAQEETLLDWIGRGVAYALTLPAK
jgi:TfoX/Sxy family transcriptional regulator of competence genes